MSLLQSAKDLLRRLMGATAEPELSQEAAEELRAAFKARYHHFKLLLAANNKALDIMTEMESALRGASPFGMNAVRAWCATVSAQVYAIAKNLDALAPGKYSGLFDRFKAIQAEIAAATAPRPPSSDGPHVLDLAEILAEHAPQVGGKSANLGELANRTGLDVPDGFAITASGYARFMEATALGAEIARRIQSADAEDLDELYALSADIQQLIAAAEIPADLAGAIRDAVSRMREARPGRLTLAMRSSALGEDAGDTSFAGQYASQLNVDPDEALTVYKEIVASKYTPQAMSYRHNRGMRDEDVAMCVAVIRMVDAASGGVLYTRNPLDPADGSVCVNSVFGLPKTVVDGSASVDFFRASRQGEILERKVVHKDRKFVCYPDEGVCRMEMDGAQADRPSLTDAQIRALAAAAARIEDHYGRPQDVEWAIDQDGRIIFLQSRPLKLAEAPAAAPPEVPADAQVLVEGGVPASPGAGAGSAHVVRRDADILSFPDGGVLVAAQAAPRLATLLARASGLVCERGSIAGHLANVAREFQVPAVFDAQRATETLAQGEVVTVDGLAGRVYAGRVESVLARVVAAPRNLMAGSPVFAALQAAAAHVVPLTLLDPDSPDFRPSGCRTLHDITRFCHELAVKEMFSFGDDHRFPERAAKQLVCNVPMQFWIINLDDGFKSEPQGKFIHIQELDCPPLMSLWKGMVAVPWAGPPPVSARGFMTVLMEATANPNLDPAMSSQYAVKNYFMISRNFISLQSRFGFHFCGVEALVGDRPMENYASFHFKGGAANMERRVLRALFVAETLEEFGFRCEVREDAAFCRIEGFEEEVMLQRLLVVGYLVTHTRQMDMVIHDRPTMEAFRAKVMDEITGILEGRIRTPYCP